MTLLSACAPQPAPTSARAGRARPEREELHLPFDIEARRAAWGEPLPDLEPTPSIAPVRDVLGESYYVDAAHSVADPAKKQRNEDALRPLRTYVKAVEKLADGFMRSSPADSNYRTRALELLDEWASAGALLGRTNQQGSYERKWMLGGLALAYFKLKTGPGDDARQERIERWLVAIAEAVQGEYERPARTDNRNNHAYWAGLAVLAVGIAANERALFDWGISRARLGIEQIETDGSLPLEMSRGGMALHYHVFALTPLIMAAELAAANGVDLYAENGYAVRRLVGLVLAAIEDTKAFGERAHVEQTFAVPPAGSALAWAEPYNRRYPDAVLTGYLRAARPIIDARLGGDVTLAFGGGL